ncbi:unnamed protein product [Somion occarium]|uniref:Uncharacterized protein n=1 Tax=Somion occarium TaxID=3059160 RepID=A0ABP1CWD6_9APHY
MQFFFLVSFYLLAVPATVLACEGDCIVEITKAFLSNYTDPIRLTMQQLAQEISYSIPNQPSPERTINYLQPLLDAYNDDAYDGMENAIFPSYFHGKCLRDGVTPPGCPNPDCDVVCGTPGSLVHFYPKLRYIAYNQTYHGLQRLASPGTDAYKQVENAILNSVHQEGPPSRRSSRLFARFSPLAGSSPTSLASRRDDDEDIRVKVQTIMAKIRPTLESVCGGSGNGETNGLPNCSWEDAMKAYILTFP